MRKLSTATLKVSTTEDTADRRSILYEKDCSSVSAVSSVVEM